MEDKENSGFWKVWIMLTIAMIGGALIALTHFMDIASTEPLGSGMAPLLVIFVLLVGLKTKRRNRSKFVYRTLVDYHRIYPPHKDISC